MNFQGINQVFEQLSSSISNVAQGVNQYTNDVNELGVLHLAIQDHLKDVDDKQEFLQNLNEALLIQLENVNTSQQDQITRLESTHIEMTNFQQQNQVLMGEFQALLTKYAIIERDYNVAQDNLNNLQGLAEKKLLDTRALETAVTEANQNLSVLKTNLKDQESSLLKKRKVIDDNISLAQNKKKKYDQLATQLKDTNKTRQDLETIQAAVKPRQSERLKKKEMYKNT
jgi:chromosome segregation ATPase